MADLSKIKLPDNTVLNLKDAQCRSDLSNLVSSLGDLAYEDTAEGSYTPAGTISSVTQFKSQGTLPSFSGTTYTYDSSTETLAIGAESFNAGTLPTGESVTPTFTGTAATIVVGPASP